MHSLIRRRLLPIVLLALAAPFSWAQAYPEKAITLVVPYPPGAAVDRVGRALAAELGRRLGKPVVVENVGGASGTLGAKKVQREPADGYTLLLGTVNDLVVAPTVLKSGYSVRDFTPIAKVSTNSTAVVAHPSFPANTIDELVVLARQSKEPLLAGATGVAVMQTIGGTLMAEAAGIRLNHVSYKGGAPLMNDLVGGQVQFGTIALTSVLPLVRDGRLKVLGVISTHRDPTAPNIPTVNEGKFVKGVEADLWTGLVGPAGLPAPVVARLASAMREILSDKTYRDAEFRAGSIPVDPGDPAAFQHYLLKEHARLQPVLAAVKVQ